MVDTWRWDVLEGKVAYQHLNRHWWRLRRQFQGVDTPMEEDRSDRFDPMAKFHIPDNTPYMP